MRRINRSSGPEFILAAAAPGANSPAVIVLAAILPPGPPVTVPVPILPPGPPVIVPGALFIFVIVPFAILPPGPPVTDPGGGPLPPPREPCSSCCNVL